MQQQLPKLLNAVILPVINPSHEIIQGLVKEIAVDSLICLLQGTLGSIDASC